MQSFRSELENLNNPMVERDILDLGKKIQLFRDGKIDDDKFRSVRLARGIYGQRQPGVQMVRIKLPLGRVTTKQIRRIADIAKEYGSGNLHATTRQDIQIHFVSLDKTPELWAKLEADDITIREACGNTVRNITASPTAGIDPKEPFDVTPYANEMFRYLLRNPICQEMGRKFKISFSSSTDDTAFAFIHDVGLIPVLRDNERGFKVVIGGGLGANPYLAETAFEFLPTNKIIPFTEGLIRVFDRYGERNRRMKARMKFLLMDIGLQELLRLVEEEAKAVRSETYEIAVGNEEKIKEVQLDDIEVTVNEVKFSRWHKTNTIAQKQQGYFGVYVKLPLGNLSSARARQFADVVDKFAGNEMRVTVNQGYLIRFVKEKALKPLFAALDNLGLAEPGFDSIADVTACPGTESCNLAISDSTNIALALEKVIREEYPDLIFNNDIKIKISGCPNSCGQHGLASIGLHGSTIKDKQGKVLPALVVLLGGGNVGNGEGIISDKLIKIPSRRGPDALRLLLNDYESNSLPGEYYHNYFKRLGRNYFYTLLKPLGDVTNTLPLEYIDWGHDEKFILQTAVGECAGVMIDLIATLFADSEEKLTSSKEAFEKKWFADAIYHSYSSFVNTAKAMLLSIDIKPSTQIQTINDFHEKFVASGQFPFEGDFKEHVLRINKQAAEEGFSLIFRADAERFLKTAIEFRASQQKNYQDEPTLSAS